MQGRRKQGGGPKNMAAILQGLLHSGTALSLPTVRRSAYSCPRWRDLHHCTFLMAECAAPSLPHIPPHFFCLAPPFTSFMQGLIPTVGIYLKNSFKGPLGGFFQNSVEVTQGNPRKSFSQPVTFSLNTFSFWQKIIKYKVN